MPAPDASQCSTVGPHDPFTMTGAPAVSASITVMEKASCGEGRDEGASTTQEPPLGGIPDHAGHDHVVRHIGRVDHLADEDESQRLGMALLVGAEPAPQHAGPLLVVNPADAKQVRVFAQVEANPCRLGVGSDRVGPRLLDPETHEHLRCVRDAETGG